MTSQLLLVKQTRKLMIKPYLGFKNISTLNNQAHLKSEFMKPQMSKQDVNNEVQELINKAIKEASLNDRLNINFNNFYYGPTNHYYGNHYYGNHYYGNHSYGNHYHNDTYNHGYPQKSSNDITEKVLNCVKSITLVIFVGFFVLIGVNLTVIKSEPATYPHSFWVLKSTWECLMIIFKLKKVGDKNDGGQKKSSWWSNIFF